MKKALLQMALCLPLLAGTDIARAQGHTHTGVCGTSVADQQVFMERMHENRRNRDAILARRDLMLRNNDSTVYIPLQFHFVGQSDGTGFINADNVWANMCRLNADYADQNIQFYLYAPPRYISSTSLYNNNDRGNGMVNYLMALNKVPQAVNIYIGNVIASSGFGTTLGYYTSYPDVIYCIRGTINGTSKTLTHELGHFFTLAHPFFGWEDQDYRDVAAVNGGKAPEYSGGGTLTERVARSGGSENCQIAADGFCDTKPDYNFGIFAGGCTMPFPAFDPDSVALDPASSADNYMSYFGDNCTNSFSNEQKDAIVLDVISRGYDLLPDPSLLEVSQAPVLTWPNETSPSPYTTAQLRWEAVPNATLYTVTIDRMINGTFVSRVGQWVTHENTLWVGLTPNHQFRWTVRATNSIDFCDNNAASADFVTYDWEVGVDQLGDSGLNDMRLFPNPANRQAPVALELDVTQHIEATISITNSLGQRVMPRQQLVLVQGTNVEQLDLSMLATGMYFVTVETSEGRTTRKLMLD